MCRFDIRRKGSNTIFPSEFGEARRYCSERLDQTVDITIVTGQFWDDHAVEILLLMRFHKVDPNDTMSNANVQALYEALSKVMGKNGYEHRRIGGSSGRLQPTPNFFKFIQHNSMSNFPRFRKSMKFIKAKGDVKWECYYMGVNDFEVKKTFCCNIQKGGAFSMPPDLMTKFPFLQDFLATKAKAALILYQVNGPLTTGKIQPNAVKQELTHLKKANNFDWPFLRDELMGYARKRNIGKKKEYVMKYFSTMNKHTVVQHCVGFHLDIVKGQPVLENKVCFRLSSKGNDNGRCGGGQRMFVFALLDWPKKNKVRNAVYRALGGPQIVGQRLTEYNWQAFRTLFRIPEIPNNVRATDEAVDERIAEARRHHAQDQQHHPHLRFE